MEVTADNDLVLGGGHVPAEDGGVNRISFTLPSLPGSVNIIYGPRRTIYSENGWGLKDEWLIWATKVKPYVLLLPCKPANSSVIRVDRCYYYPWFCKNGNWKKIDTSNLDKLLFDTISQKIGIDDRFFKSGWMDSCDSSNPRVEVTLTEITKTEWERRRERFRLETGTDYGRS